MKPEKQQTVNDLDIYGFRSIRECNITLGNLNVFIGVNGAGKSNLVSVFSFLRQINLGNLQRTVIDAGGANRVLHFGRKRTPSIQMTVRWTVDSDRNWPVYGCVLKATDTDSLYLDMENYFEGDQKESCRAGVSETSIEAKRLESFRVCHFHDTSRESPLRQAATLHDDRFLRENGSNLPAFLYRLSKSDPAAFRIIEGTIRQVAPFFERFELEPSRDGAEVIRLEWREKGSDEYFNAAMLSDGTLRFIALATLLLQPDPPPLILLDEPELGLHPAAIVLLADMLRSASARTQVLVATQSVTLVNQLEPEDLHVVERDAEGASTFRHLKDADMSDWLEEYGLGDLWEKNVIGGRP